MREMDNACSIYWMCNGWGFIMVGPRMRHEKHGHEVLRDAHWLTKMRPCKQRHVLAVSSLRDGISWGNPHLGA